MTGSLRSISCARPHSTKAVHYLFHCFLSLITLVLLSLFVAPIAFAEPIQRPVTIKIWEYPRWRENEQAVDRFYWLKRRISEFERLHPGISVELTELTWEHGEDKKKIAITAGVGPDIISGVLPVQLVESGLVEPIDDYLSPEKKADFLAPALESFSYKGKVYGWPWYLTGAVLIANAELLNPPGVSAPAPNWTYAEFSDYVQRLTRDRDGDGRPDTYGFAFLIRPGDTSVWPFLFPAGTPSLASDGGINAFTNEADADFLYNLVQTYHAAPAFCAAWDAETLWQRFTAQRDIAIVPLGIWAIPRLRALKDFKFDVLPFPAPGEQKPPARAFVGTSGFMVLRQSDAQKRRLCMEFAQFLVRPEAQKDLAQYGVIPSTISAGDIYPGDAVMSKVQQILSTGQTVPPHAQWAEIDEKFQRELQLALLGRKSVSTAMAESARRIKEVLRPSAAAASGRDAGPMPTVVGLAGAVVACLAGFLFMILKRRQTNSASAFTFLLPALLIFAVFLLFPLCWVFFLAFEDFSFARAGASWVGLQNLSRALADPVFQRATANTFVYTAVVVPANIFSALLVASLIHPLSKRARSFFRGAYYLPGVVSVVALAMAWRWMFNENIGVLNTALEFFGLPGVRWLTDTRIALWSVILTSIARPPGGPVLIYLAALDAIPSSLYDAAELDGANPAKKWWHITIPLLKPTTLFLALTITIGCFQVFAQVFILTDGGPGYATEVVTHQIYTTAIRDFDFGLAAAMSLLLFAIIMLASFVQYRWFNSEIEY
jgi:multiple sugar transport system permease protein